MAPTQQAATPSLPPTPPAPQKPPFYQPVLDWFQGIHIVVRVGIVLLFIGVALLFRYAVDQGWLSLELRLATAGILGLALVGMGWRLRGRNRGYALTLQGGGFGITYMTVFASFRIYQMIPASLAFGLLVVLVVVNAGLSVLADSKPLVVLAMLGGFLTPILASTGEGSHVTLFSFYLVLNVGILGIAWFKAWRELNLVGFLFTFVLGGFWGYQFYRPQFFNSVEPFLVIFFLFYVAIALLFARRQPPHLAGVVDGPLLFGPPLVGFGLQAALVADFEYGLAWSAGGLGLFYLLLGWALFRWRLTHSRTLAVIFVALGAIFVTLAVPFALDNQYTSAVWAIEGAGLLWLSLRWPNRFYRYFGILVQAGAGIGVLIEIVDLIDRWPPTLVNSAYLGTVIAGLAALASAYWVNRAARALPEMVSPDPVPIPTALVDDKVLGDPDLEAGPLAAEKVETVDRGPARQVWEFGLLSWLLSLYGLGMWFLGGGLEAVVVVDVTQSVMGYGLAGFMAFAALSAMIYEEVGRRLAWAALRLPILGIWALAAILFVAHQGVEGQGLLVSSLGSGGWYGWSLALLAHYLLLWRREKGSGWQKLYHGIGLWMAVSWVTVEVLAQTAEGLQLRIGSMDAALLILPAALVIQLLSVAGHRLGWPVARHLWAYLTVGLAPLAGLAALWMLVINLSHSGNTAPFTYLPVLNPLDLTSLLVLAALLIWLQRLLEIHVSPIAVRWGRLVVIGLAFLFLNALMARTAHHLLGVGFTMNALLGYEPLQAAYSIVWGGLALALMFGATRRGARWVWMAGGALLGLTVVKLFAVDLASSGTVARIVSFIGVGLLMLVIGYFAPAPPGGEETEPS